MPALHTSSRTSGPVGRFGTLPRAESAWRSGTYTTHSPAKYTSFNIITSAPELPVRSWHLACNALNSRAPVPAVFFAESSHSVFAHTSPYLPIPPHTSLM